MVFSTMEHAWGLVGQWWMLSLLIFATMTFMCWDYKWYAFLRDTSPAPPMRGLFIVMTVMITANSWSVWRLWRCENWDADAAPLIIYILLIVAIHAYVPALMALKSLWLCMATALISCGLAIAYTVLAFVEADTYAGIVGVFDIVHGLLQLIFTLYLNPLREEYILNKYRGIPQPARTKTGVVVVEDQKVEQPAPEDEDTEFGEPAPLFNANRIPEAGDPNKLSIRPSIKFSL